MGFEPGEPVHEYTYCFSKEQLQEALFSSTYSTPVPVYLTQDGRRDSPSELIAKIPIVVTCVAPRFMLIGDATDATSVGGYDGPQWYVEGWVPKSGYDPVDSPVRRIRVRVCDDFALFYWQVIPDRPLSHELIKLSTE